MNLGSLSRGTLASAILQGKATANNLATQVP